MSELRSEMLCEIVTDIGDPQDIGATPHGMRLIYPTLGGTVAGSKLNGTVLSFGADWALFRTDGATELDVRCTIQADTGDLIYYQCKGILDASDEIIQCLTNGEDVDESQYYCRTTIMFETGSEKYGWLNKIVCVGKIKFETNRIRHKTFQIL